MLGYLAAAFAWGAVKAHVMGAHRTQPSPLHRLGLAELGEELEFRGLLERVAVPAAFGTMGAVPVAAKLGQAVLFGALHPGLEVDAAVGGLVYSLAWDTAKRANFLGLGPFAGLAGAYLTHVAHNTGCWWASKPGGTS